MGGWVEDDLLENVFTLAKGIKNIGLNCKEHEDGCPKNMKIITHWWCEEGVFVEGEGPIGWSQCGDDEMDGKYRRWAMIIGVW